MKQLLALTAIVMAFVCSGCSGGDTHESLTADGISTMKEFVATLETIKDEATAKAAKPKLKAQLEEMKSIKDRQSKLPTPSEADGKAILAKHGPELEVLQKKLTSNMFRIAIDPKMRAALEDLDMTSAK